MLIKEEKIAKIEEQRIKSDAILKSKKIINQNTLTPIEAKLKTLENQINYLSKEDIYMTN